MNWTLPHIRTAPVPTRSQIEDINAGVMAGSRYRNALAKTWAAIRDEYDERMRRRFSVVSCGDPDADRDAARLCHQIVIAELDDAIEWARALDRSVPAQNGSMSEIGHFSSSALRALETADHLDHDGVEQLKALMELRDLGKQAESIQRRIAEGVAAARTSGVTWADVGEALGMSKQGAQQRYGR